jgi:hypothetical protein
MTTTTMTIITTMTRKMTTMMTKLVVPPSDLHAVLHAVEEWDILAENDALLEPRRWMYWMMPKMML